MATLGTVANVLGVITPAKDVVEAIKAIADSVEEVKRNRAKVSELIEALKTYLMRLDTAISRYTDASDRQMQGLLDLQKSLILMLKELVEQSRSNSAFFSFSFSQWWNSGDITIKLKKLEKKIKFCHELFVFDSLTHILHTVDSHTSTLISIQTRIVDSSDNTVQSNLGDRIPGNGEKTRVERTTIIWKIPMKADLNNPKIVNYTYLSSKIVTLLKALKSNGEWIEGLLRNNLKDFKNTPVILRRYPLGDPTRECEDASDKAIQLTRVVQDQDSYISIIEWLDDLSKLASALYNVGLKKEAMQIWQFKYRILTLASEEGNNVDSDLAQCLYNMALFCFDEGVVGIISLLERAVKIYRRLGISFIPFLANSLRFLSNCYRRLGQFENAANSIQESIDLFRELASENPSQYAREMVDCLTDKALLYFMDQEYEKAIICFEEANRWFSKSYRGFKEDFPCEYAWARWCAALAYEELDDFGKAEEHGREATKMFNGLIRDRPLFYLTDSTSIDLADWFQSMGRSQDAVCILEESLSVYCSVLPSPAVQEKFADTLYSRAEILHSRGNFTDTLDALSQVIDVRHHLLEEDETNFNYLIDLLATFRLRSSCLISLHRQSEAIKTIETALETLRSSLVQVELDGSRIYSIFQELVSQESMLEKYDSAEAISNLREFKKAVLCIDKAISVFRRRIFNREYFHSNLAQLLELRFMIFSQIGKFDVAQLSIQEAVDLYHYMVDKNGDVESRSNLTRALNSLARCLNSIQSPEAALASLDKALQQIQSIIGDKQTRINIDLFINILHFHDTLIEHLIVVEKYSEALHSMTMSIEIVRLLYLEYQNRVQELLGCILMKWSICSFRLGNLAEALYNTEEALQIYRCMVAKDAEKHEWKLAVSLYQRAILSLALLNFEDALKSIEETLVIESRIELKNPDGIRSDLSKSTALHAEILYRMGRAAGAQNALSQTWMIEIYAKNNSGKVVEVK